MKESLQDSSNTSAGSERRRDYTLRLDMNDTTTKQPPVIEELAPPPAPPPATRSGRAWIGGAALLLALVAVGLVAFEWHASRGNVEALRQDVAKKLADVDTL